MIIAAALCCVPLPASADAFDVVSFGVHGGTLGYGLTFERPLLYNFSVRVTTGVLSTSQTRSYDASPYTATFHQNNVLVAADYRPSSARLRLSAGLLFGNERIDNVANVASGTFAANGHLYPAAGTGNVTNRITFDRPGLYAGAGAGTGLVRGTSLSIDAGIVVRNGKSSIAATGPLQNDPTFAADLVALRGRFKTRFVSPVFGVGLMVRP